MDVFRKLTMDSPVDEEEFKSAQTRDHRQGIPPALTATSGAARRPPRKRYP